MCGCKCKGGPENILIIGMKHCGKSTLGEFLAAQLGARFMDTDDLIEVVHLSESGSYQPFREIFRDHGREYFENLERRAVKELFSQLVGTPELSVIAFGGRTALHEDLHKILKHMGRIVYIQNDPKELYRRVVAGGLPPFLDKDDPEGSFMALYEERVGVYEKLADVIVDARGLTAEQVGQAAMKQLGIAKT